MAFKQEETEAASERDGKEQIDMVSLLLDRMQNIDLNKVSEDQLNKKNKTKEIIIPKWLEGCESPFFWHSTEVRGLGVDQVIIRSLGKLKELDIEEPNFSVQRYVSMLKLVLEYFIIENIDKSWEFMEEIEDLLEREVSEDNILYLKMKLSLGHVVSATKAQLLFLDGEEEKSRKIGQNIIPIKIMGAHDKAALCAMKARFYLYSGYENGENLSVQLARQAMELDPGYEEWKYLLAKMLRQQRRDVPFSMDIPREELQLLEKAVEESRNAKYLVYLAQVYRECGKQAFLQYKEQPGFFNSELFKTIDDMSKKALHYYKEALELEPDRPSCLRRVGYGIMNLPRTIADYELALSCLLKSLELSENQMTLHVLGTYYQRYGNDSIKALEYFEKTAKQGSHAGLSDMVRVKYLMDSTYDPCEDLKTGLKWEMKKKDRISLLVQLGGYFLLIKRDFQKSIEYFIEVISEDKDSAHMKRFKSFFLRMPETIDLYQYLVNEALLLLQENTSTGRGQKTADGGIEDHGGNLVYVEDFLDKISEIQPDLMEMSPDPKLIDTLCQLSEHVKAKESASRNHRRGNQSRGGGNRGYNRGYKKQFNRSEEGRTQARGHDNLSEEGCERGRFSHTNTTEEMSERRGRFSIANQRDRDSSNDNSDRRGRFSGRYNRGDRGRNQNRESSWRQENLRPETPNDQNQHDKVEYKGNNQFKENWRKK